MKTAHIGSDAREMIKIWEQKEPQIRIDIEKCKRRKRIAHLVKLTHSASHPHKTKAGG
jgi:hypothetical protein